MEDSNSKKKSSLSEPPKFNLEDLPEPPKIGQEELSAGKQKKKNKDMKIPEPLETSENSDSTIPMPVQMENKKEPNFNVSIFDNKESESLAAGSIPEPPKLEQAKKKGFFFRLFGKKEKEERIDVLGFSSPLSAPLSIEEKPEKTEAKPDNNEFHDSMFAPVAKDEKRNEEINPEQEFKFSEEDAAKSEEKEDEEPKFEISESSEKNEGPEWLSEGSHFMEGEELEEAKGFIEKDEAEEAEDYLKQVTPLSEVKGVGEKSAKKLKKAGIKSAEHLASHQYKALAKKAKLPEAQAKKIVTNAKKLAKIKENLKQSKKEKEKGISSIISQLEAEKREIERIQKKSEFSEDALINIEGHRDIIDVLNQLEKKRQELVAMEEKLSEREIKLSKNDEHYKRDMESIDTLKRRLDHDIRERTQYLVNLEKEYFQRAQILAKKQSDVEIKEKSLTEREKFLVDKETSLKKQLNEFEDRSLTLNTKEKKFDKIMQSLEKQDVLLKEKEEDLIKREEEYLAKLGTLESHEQTILRNLEEKRRRLETKEKEVELKEKSLHKKERNVDKKSIAMEYAQNILEEQKGKLVDDEFEQYLHEQLGMLKNSSGASIGLSDMNIVKNIHLPDTNSRNDTIYQLIDTCKDLIKQRRVTEAKVFYNQLRDKYYTYKFSSSGEKESVHNMIRSLYDEIKLGEMG